MRQRIWLTGCGWALTLTSVLAQTPASECQLHCTPAPIVPLTQCACTQGPVLLPVPELPSTANSPTPSPDTGPNVEYDRSLLYLPDTKPESAVGPVAPDPETLRIWMAGGVFFGWSSAPSGGPLILSSDGSSIHSVFGTNSPESPFRAGFRFDGGLWLNEPRTIGIEASSLYLPQAGGSTLITAGGPTSLLVPVSLSCGCTSEPFPLAGPDRTGIFTADWSSRFVTADIDLWKELYRGDHLRIAGTAGYRFGYLGENFTTRSATVSASTDVARFLDVAQTINTFHGGQLGLTGGVRTDRWAFDLAGEVALGSVFSNSDRNGSTAVGTSLAPGGLFARPANSGRIEEARFAWLPTLSAAVSRQFSNHGKVFVGYTLHYLTDVVRPGGMIGPASDPGGLGTMLTREPGTSDFWVQGVNLGVEWEY